MAAAQLGTELRVSIAPEVEQLHQALILSARGLLPVVAPMFADDLKPEADPVELALAGYVALAVGDLDRTAEAARLLAKRDDFLSSAGATWALVAHMAAELARPSGTSISDDGCSTSCTTAPGPGSRSSASRCSVRPTACWAWRSSRPATSPVGATSSPEPSRPTRRRG